MGQVIFVLILGIETSCDETAASVVYNGTQIMSNVVSSQIKVHSPFGGVVPELASRKHMEAIVPVVNEAISASGIDKEQLDAVAVTRGPGLVGSLLVGFCFARAFAIALGIPWLGIDHLEGHINSLFLENNPPLFPFVALLVSGGHTNIYYVTSHIEYELMGQTRDDAAGEAFDKVSKMLGLGYPGGITIENLAKAGNKDKISFPRAYLDKDRFDFSFSGVKTAVNRHIQTCSEKHVEDIAAGFQEAVVDVLSYKLIKAAMVKKSRHIALAGGVAANSRLRDRVRKDAGVNGISVHVPSSKLCGDNGAMIAACAFHYLVNGKFSSVDDDVFSRSPLKTFGVGQF